MSINYCLVSPSNVSHLMKQCLKIENWASCFMVSASRYYSLLSELIGPFRFSFACLEFEKPKPSGDLSLRSHFQMSRCDIQSKCLSNICAFLLSLGLTFHGANFCFFFLLELCK